MENSREAEKQGQRGWLERTPNPRITTPPLLPTTWLDDSEHSDHLGIVNK
jgi:hypothetical protein